MPNRRLRGSTERMVYRNERYTKGTVTSNDPMYEGSFKRLINFNISNQNASLQNREPFISVPLYDTKNNPIVLSTESILFSFNEDTNYAYIVDFNTTKETNKENKFKAKDIIITNSDEIEIVDGDTFKYKNKRYRLALIDAPELNDQTYEPIKSDSFYSSLSTKPKPKNLGEQARDFARSKLDGKIKADIIIVQFNFQTELIDEFGRELVYVFYKSSQESGHNYNLLNFNLLKQGYASFYNLHTYQRKSLAMFVPKKIYFEIGENEIEFKMYDELHNSYIENPNWNSAYSNKYIDIEIDFYPQEDFEVYKKPKIYKITKQTNLEKAEVDFKENKWNKVDEGNVKVFKRAVDEFDLMELNTKFDLELPNDDSLRYELVSKEHIVMNSKYGNQTLNFFVRVYNINNYLLYTGPAEITRTSPDLDNGIYETFHIKTYKKPEMHVEFQDITNYKPNILSDRSVIPETLINQRANVQGITTPKVNAVLLNSKINKYFGLDNEGKMLKYFLPSSPKQVDIDKFEITPFYKAPVIHSNKSEYMYRWDIISNKEIDINILDDLNEYKPIYRSAWTNLKDQSTTLLNLDSNKKARAINLENLKTADEFFILTTKEIAVNDEDEFLENLSKNTKNIHDENNKLLFEYNEELKNFIENSSYQELKEAVENNSVNISEINYEIRKLQNNRQTLSFFSDNREKETIVIDIEKEKVPETLNEHSSKELINKIDGEEIRAAFIFVPFKIEIKETLEKVTTTREIFFNSETRGFVLETDKQQENEENVLPINIKLSDFPEEILQKNKIIKRVVETQEYKRSPIIANPTTNEETYVYGTSPTLEQKHPYVYSTAPVLNTVKTIETKYQTETIKTTNFIKEGFTAVFYLLNYNPEEKLTETSEYYDNIAYKASSPTYSFKEGSLGNYHLSDFIDDRLDKESYMIKYCKYITEFNDRAIVYGNPMYNNVIFMSEEGSPYYYGLASAFEFDHEVVHVQQFKTILMVFTVNDIWVIYEIEEKEQQEYQDEEGKTQTYEVTKHSFRSKKILYNISTTHENKCTIKNISRYVTLMSNDVLYLIKPSLYISDDTQFTLNILSSNIDALVKDPLPFINERLIYHGIKELATEYKMNLNATDNFIKLYYSVEVSNKPYTLILTYDILNNRWYEEDTLAFGYPQQIYLLDASTKYEMLTVSPDNKMYITYNTDKYKNLLMNEYGESYFDIYPTNDGFEEQRIQYYIDTGYIKLSEHLRKRFRLLQIHMKNIDSKEILFTYNFSVDDIQFENNFIPEVMVNNSNVFEELSTVKEQSLEVPDIKEFMFKLKHNTVFNVGFLDDFFLDFSNLTSSDIMMLRHNLIGRGRMPRVKMGFSAKNRFYILSFGIVYSEKRGK